VACWQDSGKQVDLATDVAKADHDRYVKSSQAAQIKRYGLAPPM
jgi:hypothetical protein